MKFYSLKMFSAIALFLSVLNIHAQCDFNPTITGNILLCTVSDEITISTQTYDSYQWYRRKWKSNPTEDPFPWVLVEGATGQTLTVNGTDDILYEFKVAATLGSCTEESPLELVNGYVYGLPYMISTFEPNTFERIGELEYNICNGASVQFENGFPEVYGDLTWFKCLPSSPADPTDPCIIPGVTGDIYTATTDGNYGFYSCTTYCPGICEFLGSLGFIKLNFGDFEFCSLGTDDPQADKLSLNVYPNPTVQFISLAKIDNLTNGDFSIVDMNGRLIKQLRNVSLQAPIDVSDLASGTYNIIVNADGKNYTNKFIKK